jgi:hypothetical protein
VQMHIQNTPCNTTLDTVFNKPWLGVEEGCMITNYDEAPIIIDYNTYKKRNEGKKNEDKEVCNVVE